MRCDSPFLRKRPLNRHSSAFLTAERGQNADILRKNSDFSGILRGFRIKRRFLRENPASHESHRASALIFADCSTGVHPASAQKRSQNRVFERFQRKVLLFTAFLKILRRTSAIPRSRKNQYGFCMGFRKKSSKNMGFAAKLWVCAVDFERKWSIMGESLEAGNCGVCRDFPLFSTPANAVVESQTGFLKIRVSAVRSRPCPMALSLEVEGQKPYRRTFRRATKMPE